MKQLQHIPFPLPRLLSLSVLLLGVVSGRGQEYDTLSTVDIRARKKLSSEVRLDAFSSGQKVHNIDSTTLRQYDNQSLATLLTQQMPVFVKAYSFNGLATVSFRGASAAQSQVLWNGVPIQNAALGVADISTLPVLFVNKVNVVYGGSGALYGSGNVGGALLLENEPTCFDTSSKTLTANMGAGSFGQYCGGLQGSISGNRWYISGKLFGQTATNDYSYRTQQGLTERMNNGRLQSGNAMLKAAYKLNNKETIDLNLWYQDYDRQIPPALFESYSVKQQNDESFRSVVNWEHKAYEHTVYAKASFISDRIKYEDAAVALRTSNAVQQYFAEAGWRQAIGHNSQLLVFVPVQISLLPNGVDSQRQTRVALAAAYNLKALNKRLDISVQARAEVINDQKIFLPGSGLSYRFTDWLQLRANVQRTYRVPTLNELYYFPGGNAMLQPERGWSQDAGYALSRQLGSFRLAHDLSVFNRNIDDWIVWLGGAVWTPHNLASVHSRGIETENSIEYRRKDWRYRLSAHTSYILSTTSDSYVMNDGSIGKQIPYTPRYNGRATINIGFRNVSLTYSHSYTGYRFITTDESYWLEPYQTGNLSGSYAFTLSGVDMGLNAQYNNVWNARYSIAGFRPMPLANWLIGIRASIR